MENTNLGLVAGNVLNPRPSQVWRQCLEGKSDLKGEEGNHGILKALKRIQTSPHAIGGKLWLKETGGRGFPKEALVPEREVRTGFGIWPLKSHLSQWLLAADNTQGLLRRKVCLSRRNAHQFFFRHGLFVLDDSGRVREC